MKTDLRSKFFDGILSGIIMMLVMYPLIILFRYLEQWGTTSYWVAAIVFLAAALWLLYRATLEKLSEIGRGWYGVIGGFCAWTVTEVSHSINLIDIEGPDIVLVLALVIGFLTILWQYFPVGARFWIMMFMMNWVGHVFIHSGEELFGEVAKTIFTATAVGYGLMLLGLIYWIFARTTTRTQRLWCGLWIWHALSMMFFLLR